ncbi:hypothetical protein AAKU64_003848 [Undibacterium sp. GrIS 1.8]|uniref:hypothetical protein n=1 Tax=unclassified Undibacterium TaxID=2630295 RepID=UPI0033949622
MKTKKTPFPLPTHKDDSNVLTGESHADSALDEALKESFPASDAIAVEISVPPSLPKTTVQSSTPKIKKK